MRRMTGAHLSSMLQPSPLRCRSPVGAGPLPGWPLRRALILPLVVLSRMSRHSSPPIRLLIASATRRPKSPAEWTAPEPSTTMNLWVCMSFMT
jgi:hypothetical protein